MLQPFGATQGSAAHKRHNGAADGMVEHLSYWTEWFIGRAQLPPFPMGTGSWAAAAPIMEKVSPLLARRLARRQGAAEKGQFAQWQM